MKTRVLMCVLCGPERTDWINPALCLSLLRMQRDSRFEVVIEACYGHRPFDRARNMSVIQARACNAEWLVQIDNDIVPPSNLLTILHDAIISGKQVVGLGRGAQFDGGELKVLPNDNGQKDGDFQITGCVAGGVFLINAEVWRNIPGPWFRWVTNEDESLSWKLSEDYYFCELIQKHGFKLWTHQCLAGHRKTVDITGVSLSLMRKSTTLT
jgi:hypothetical protein